LSFTTISILSSNVYADSRSISGGGCSSGNCTISDSQSSKVTISGSGDSLTITKDGSITANNSEVILVQESAGDNITIKNEGTVTNNKTNGGFGVDIKSGNTIKEFSNSGSITSDKETIVIRGGATIEKFNNSGTLTSNNSSGMYIQGTIKEFENAGNGTIEGTNGINIVEGGKIENLTNDGTIQGQNGIAIRSGGAVGTINNKGTINAGEGYYKGAIFVNNGSVSNINNNGSLQGSNGILIENGTVGNITNNGTIQSVGSGNFTGYGVLLAGGKIDTLTNTGTIISEGTNAIQVDGGARIEKVEIKGGLVESQKGSGIYVSYGSYGSITINETAKVKGASAGISVGQWQQMGALSIDGKDSAVIGGENGIYIDTGSRTSTITLTNGGKIQGGNAGIYLNNAFLSGNTTIDGEGSSISGGIAGIYLNKGSFDGTIEVKNGGSIFGGSITKEGESQNGYGIVNAQDAKIKGSILVNSGGSIGGILNQDNASLIGDIKVSGANSQIIGG
ncbi:beta strand repeat-containing protein, partial [Helicobacter burdigaliensis]